MAVKLLWYRNFRGSEASMVPKLSCVVKLLWYETFVCCEASTHGTETFVSSEASMVMKILSW